MNLIFVSMVVYCVYGYFCAYTRSGIYIIYKKHARELGVGRLQIYAGVNGKNTGHFPDFKVN